MTKPIYERAIWKVLKEVAGQLKLAHSHCPLKNDYDCHRHIEAAEMIITNHVLEDMKKAEQCQRKRSKE